MVPRISVAFQVLLLALQAWSGGRASRLDLRAQCAGSALYFCSLTNVSESYDDPLIVANATAAALTELVLRDGVLGRVPRELFERAPQLRTFVMHKCGLNRLAPADFERARPLRKLVLQHNRLFLLPERAFSGAPALEELLLGHNTVHMVQRGALAGLVRLRHLDLQHNGVRSLPEGLFADLVSLEHVDLSSNEIEKIDAATFAANRRLRTVLLGDNKFSAFAPDSLTHLAHLRLLDLSNSALEELRLQSVDTLLVAGSGLKRCSIAGGVVKLHAANNALRGVSVADKLAVRELDLHGNRLQSLDDLAGMANLQRLDVSRNQLVSLQTSHSPLYLPLPSLAHLNLAFNQLRNLSAEQLLFLQKLTHLDLAFNRLQQLDARALEPLAELERLYVEGNALHDFDFVRLRRAHQSLHEVGLFHNDWEPRFLRRTLVFLRDHGVQLPIRFAPSDASSAYHSSPEAASSASVLSPKSVGRHRFEGSSDVDLLTDLALAQGQTHAQQLSGIHPYWTTRDILALLTLILVLLVLLVQCFRILQEEQCLPWSSIRMWGTGRRGEAADAVHSPRGRLVEEDSEV